MQSYDNSCSIVFEMVKKEIRMSFSCTLCDWCLRSRAIGRSNCFHKYGHEAKCHASNYKYMCIFGAAEIFLSQIPDFHNLSGLSFIAAVMSFGYSSIGIALSIAKIAGSPLHLINTFYYVHNHFLCHA